MNLLLGWLHNASGATDGLAGWAIATPVEPGHDSVTALAGLVSGAGTDSGGPAEERQQLAVDLRGVGDAHHVRAALDLDVLRVR